MPGSLLLTQMLNVWPEFWNAGECHEDLNLFLNFEGLETPQQEYGILVKTARMVPHSWCLGIAYGKEDRTFPATRMSLL